MTREIAIALVSILFVLAVAPSAVASPALDIRTLSCSSGFSGASASCPTGSLAISQTGLIASYDMHTTSSGKLTDFGPNHFDLSVQGTVNIGNNVTPFGSGTGTRFTPGGTTNFLHSQSFSNLSTNGGLTFALWMFVQTRTPAFAGITVQMAPVYPPFSSEAHFILQHQQSAGYGIGEYIWYLQNTNSSIHYHLDSTALAWTGFWEPLVLTWNQTNGHISRYRNGTLDGWFPNGSVPSPWHQYPLDNFNVIRIYGDTFGTGNYNVTYAQAMFFDRVLTNSEIAIFSTIGGGANPPSDGGGYPPGWSNTAPPQVDLFVVVPDAIFVVSGVTLALAFFARAPLGRSRVILWAIFLASGFYLLWLFYGVH